MSLKLISWNVNMFRPDKPELEKDIILELNKNIDGVDIIILIESSYGFIKNLLKSELGKTFIQLNKFSLSHGGIINILHTKKVKEIEHIDVESPALLIKFKINKKTVFLGGCHLAPFPENSEKRIQELLLIRSEVPLNSNLILVGDMNIREKETKFLEKKDNIMQLKDSGNKTKTWHRAFFDDTSYHITSRFDRLFISPDMKINQFELFGKKYNNKKVKFLSDHMAIKADITL